MSQADAMSTSRCDVNKDGGGLVSNRPVCGPVSFVPLIECGRQYLGGKPDL